MNTRLLLSILVLSSACIDADIRDAMCDKSITVEACDPIRQSDNKEAGQCCWEFQHCSYGITGQGVCVPNQTAEAPKAGDRCLFENAGTAKQTDNCGDNLVCMTVEKGGDEYRCMTRCEANRDCPNVNCSSRAGISADWENIRVKVCDPGAYLECGTDTTKCCDPLSLNNPDQCAQGQICRLLNPENLGSLLGQSSHSFTTCDFAKGTGSSATRATCRGDWECMEKHVCIGGFCKRICEVNPTLSSPACGDANPECNPLGDNYGYCQF